MLDEHQCPGLGPRTSGSTRLSAANYRDRFCPREQCLLPRRNRRPDRRGGFSLPLRWNCPVCRRSDGSGTAPTGLATRAFTGAHALRFRSWLRAGDDGRGGWERFAAQRRARGVPDRLYAYEVAVITPSVIHPAITPDKSASRLESVPPRAEEEPGAMR